VSKIGAEVFKGKPSGLGGSSFILFNKMLININGLTKKYYNYSNLMDIKKKKKFFDFR
jgi:hypothetical protein